MTRRLVRDLKNQKRAVTKCLNLGGYYEFD